MWLGVDPLWEKYAGMSPYNYCAGNPVRLVDPDGRRIAEASIEEWGNIRGSINEVKGQLEKSENDIDKERIKILDAALKDMDVMENDTKKTFKLQPFEMQSNNTTAEITQTAEDIENGIYVLSYVKGDKGNAIHEAVKHGAQISKGEIIFSIDENRNVNASLGKGVSLFNLESDAYKAQCAYNGKLTGYRVPHQGDIEYKFILIPGHPNTRFEITNPSDITRDFIKEITEMNGGPLYHE